MTCNNDPRQRSSAVTKDDLWAAIRQRDANINAAYAILNKLNQTSAIKDAKAALCRPVPFNEPQAAPVTPDVEAVAEKLQQHWQGGGHAHTRPWNNDTDKDCVHGLPGQAEFFRELARIATSSVTRPQRG